MISIVAINLMNSSSSREMFALLRQFFVLNKCWCFKEWNQISNCEAYYELVKHMTSQRYPALAWRSNLVTSPGRCQLKFDCRSSRSLIAFMDMARVRSNWKSLLSTMLCNWFWSGEPFYFFQPDWKAFNKSAEGEISSAVVVCWRR